MPKCDSKQQCKNLSVNEKSYQKAICNKKVGLGNKLENKNPLKLHFEAHSRILDLQHSRKIPVTWEI